jgi:tRNA pseudouridine38-40 synthase
MKLKLVVAYDGAGFRGFAMNQGVRTVLGTLSDAISLIVRARVDLTGAGRTDAGVHAWGQVVSGDLPAHVDLDQLVRRVNKLCAPEIAVRSAERASDDFDARFSARWRHYRYDVWNAPTPNPLLTERAWWVPRPLDVDAMNDACAPLIGEHDFSSFCRRVKVADDEPERSLVRSVMSARWSDHCEDGTSLRFEIRANAFCHQMVRAIVGTLVDVGLGKLAAADVDSILGARSRHAAGQVAPPHGLTLWEVGYRD